jgi:hypothetical protein
MFDEAKLAGNTAPTIGSSTQPYRRHIVGLPLQRSIFRLASQVATTIGLPGLISERDFPASLNENGDLFLDRSKVASLTTALRAWFTSENLQLMHAGHAAACDALLNANRTFDSQFGSDECAIRNHIESLANRMALILAYGVLSKFVPDLLLRSLEEAGDTEPPPFPKRSAGAELMQETFALHQACFVLGYTPQTLRQKWPHVSSDVFQLVINFCRRHTGFGRLAWDSPGYEDPDYVIRVLHSACDDVDAEQLRQRLSFAKAPVLASPASQGATRIATLRRVLGFWLDFLERETWYVRREFYLCMIPLLRELAGRIREKIQAFQTADLLFLEVNELTTGTLDAAVIRTRRLDYMRNNEYLSSHGVDPNRLATILSSS